MSGEEIDDDILIQEANFEIKEPIIIECDGEIDHSFGSTTIKLIRLVEKFEELYNSTYFKDTTRTKIAWNEISNVMGVSADVCKRKWNCLRDTYRRTKRKLDDLGIDAVDPGPTTVSWEYYKYMTFLHPFIRKKKDSNPDIIEVKTEYNPDIVVTTSLPHRLKKISTNPSNERCEERKRSLMSQCESLPVQDLTTDEVYANKYPKLEATVSPDKFSSHIQSPKFTITQDHRAQRPQAIPQFNHQNFSVTAENFNSRLQEDSFGHIHLIPKATFFNQSHHGLTPARVHDNSLTNSLTFTHTKQEEEADNLFVRSIAASLSRFPPKLKAMAKVKIQKALWEAEEAFEQFPNTSINFIDTNNL